MLFIFCTSCEVSNESFESNELNTIAVASATYSYRSSTDIAANESNPYDYSGRLFSEILNVYYNSDTLFTDIDGIVNQVERIAANHSEFESIKPAFYQYPSKNRIEYFINHKYSCMDSVLDSTGLSSGAKISLTNFMNSYLLLDSSKVEFDSVYKFVIAHEDSIYKNPLLSEMDKKVILITTSIARYSAATKKKKPKKNTDPAWDFLICTLYGSAENAESSPAEAIALAVASGIAENN